MNNLLYNLSQQELYETSKMSDHLVSKTRTVSWMQFYSVTESRQGAASSLRVGRGANIVCYEMLHRASDLVSHTKGRKQIMGVW